MLVSERNPDLRSEILPRCLPSDSSGGYAPVSELLTGERWVMKPSWDQRAKTQADITHHPSLTLSTGLSLFLSFLLPPPSLAGLPHQAKPGADSRGIRDPGPQSLMLLLHLLAKAKPKAYNSTHICHPLTKHHNKKVNSA